MFLGKILPDSPKFAVSLSEFFRANLFRNAVKAADFSKVLIQSPYEKTIA